MEVVELLFYDGFGEGRTFEHGFAIDVRALCNLEVSDLSDRRIIQYAVPRCFLLHVVCV